MFAIWKSCDMIGFTTSSGLFVVNYSVGGVFCYNEVSRCWDNLRDDIWRLI